MFAISHDNGFGPLLYSEFFPTEALARAKVEYLSGEFLYPVEQFTVFWCVPVVPS